MLTTRRHAPAPPRAQQEEDGTVIVAFDDRLIREHTSGRYRGTVEHTSLRLVFSSGADATSWLNDCLTVVRLATTQPKES